MRRQDFARLTTATLRVEWARRLARPQRDSNLASARARFAACCPRLDASAPAAARQDLCSPSRSVAILQLHPHYVLQFVIIDSPSRARVLKLCRCLPLQSNEIDSDWILYVRGLYRTLILVMNALRRSIQGVN